MTWKLGVKVRTRVAQLLSVLQVEAKEQREATSSFVMIVSRRAAGNISRLLSKSQPSTSPPPLSRTTVVAINEVSLLFSDSSDVVDCLNLSGVLCSI